MLPVVGARSAQFAVGRVLSARLLAPALPSLPAGMVPASCRVIAAPLLPHSMNVAVFTTSAPVGPPTVRASLAGGACGLPLHSTCANRHLGLHARSIHTTNDSTYSRQSRTTVPWVCALGAAAAGLLLLAQDTAAEEKDTEQPSENASAVTGTRQARVLRTATLLHKESVDYVIVGDGVAALSALNEIQKHDSKGKILVISERESLPTSQGALKLSPDVEHSYLEWRRESGATAIEDIAGKNVTLLVGQSDVKVDPAAQRILFADDRYVEYDKCLLAPAGKQRHFYMLEASQDARERGAEGLGDRANTLSELSDFVKVDRLAAGRDFMKHTPTKFIKDVMVVGGGFLGVEVALALRRNKDVNVNLMFAENAALKRYIPEFLADHITKKIREYGVEVHPNTLATQVTPKLQKSFDTGTHLANQVVINTMGDKENTVVTDYLILASTHIEPNVEVARGSGLEIDDKNGGITVNQQLEAIDGLYVAGSAASYWDRNLGRRRLERLEHAVMSGSIAGYNMVYPRNKVYVHQAKYTGDLRAIGVDVCGVGECNSNYTTVSVFLSNIHSPDSDPFRKGIVYYLNGPKLVGILLWNNAQHLQQARLLLQNRQVIEDPQCLRSLIPSGPDRWLNVRAEPGIGMNDSH